MNKIIYLIPLIFLACNNNPVSGDPQVCKIDTVTGMDQYIHNSKTIYLFILNHTETISVDSTTYRRGWIGQPYKRCN